MVRNFKEKERRKCRREILPLDCCCKLGVKLSSNLGVCSDLLSSANFSLRARRVVSRDTDWQEGRATRVGHLTAAALTYDRRLGLSMWGKASASAIVSWNKTFLNKAPSKTAFTFPNAHKYFYWFDLWPRAIHSWTYTIYERDVLSNKISQLRTFLTQDVFIRVWMTLACKSVYLYTCRW